MNSQEIILDVGAGGGSICLFGTQSPDGAWSFMKETNESLHSDLLSEEDKKGLNLHTREGSVDNFPEALKLLKEYPWHQLYPVRVHPEFRQIVFDAVIKLTIADDGKNRNLCEWKIACGIPLD